MFENLNISEQQAAEAGAVIGALFGRALWRLQNDPQADALPFVSKSPKYVNARQAAGMLEVKTTKFYELAKDPEFPKKQTTPTGDKYLAAEITRYASKIKKNRKA